MERNNRTAAGTTGAARRGKGGTGSLQMVVSIVLVTSPGPGESPNVLLVGVVGDIESSFVAPSGGVAMASVGLSGLRGWVLLFTSHLSFSKEFMWFRVLPDFNNPRRVVVMWHGCAILMLHDMFLIEILGGLVSLNDVVDAEDVFRLVFGELVVW